MLEDINVAQWQSRSATSEPMSASPDLNIRRQIRLDPPNSVANRRKRFRQTAMADLHHVPLRNSPRRSYELKVRFDGHFRTEHRVLSSNAIVWSLTMGRCGQNKRPRDRLINRTATTSLEGRPVIRIDGPDEELPTFEAELRARLRLINPTADAGNGTLLADAAATIIAADAVQADVGPQAVARLTDTELAAAVKQASDLINGFVFPEVVLPFGTSARSLDAASVRIGDQHYVLVDTRSGMKRAHQAPISTNGPNFDLLLTKLQRLTSGRAWAGLGQPFVTDGIGLNEHYGIRFAPCKSAGGVLLEVPLRDPITQLPLCEIDVIVDRVEEAMIIFWAQRKELSDLAKFARGAFEEEMSLAGTIANGLCVGDIRALPFEFVDDGGEIETEKLNLYIGLKSYDAALRPALAHYNMFPDRSARTTMRQAIASYSLLASRVANGPRLFINGLAATIAKAAPDGPSSVLARLAHQLSTHVALPIKPGRYLVCELFWSNGVIRASQYDHDHFIFHWDPLKKSDVFELRDCNLPETIQNALVGRSLDELVNLGMPCPIEILRVERGDLRIVLHLRETVYAVDLSACTIADKPAPR